MAKPQKIELLVVAIVLIEFGLACAVSAGGMYTYMCHRSGDVPLVLLLHMHILFNLSCPQMRVAELSYVWGITIS